MHICQAYSRLGAALVYLDQLDRAETAYKKGLELDPANEQLKSGLKECRAKVTYFVQVVLQITIVVVQ